MDTPIVTEIPRALEPVARDTFITTGGVREPSAPTLPPPRLVALERRPQEGAR